VLGTSLSVESSERAGRISECAAGRKGEWWCDGEAGTLREKAEEGKLEKEEPGEDGGEGSAEDCGEGGEDIDCDVQGSIDSRGLPNLFNTTLYFGSVTRRAGFSNVRMNPAILRT